MIVTVAVGLRAWAGAILDMAVWAAARGAVDAVRYRPRELGLTTACAVNQPEVPRPVARWLVDAPTFPPLVLAVRAPHAAVSGAAAQMGRWFGPTASAVVRWLAGALATAADRIGAETVQRPFGARAHPGLLVPHPHAVGVLAVDMRGFSRLTRALAGGTSLVELIEEYLSVLTRVVEQHRGVVFDYTGDGLLALFLPELAGLPHGAMLDRLVHGMAPELHRAFDDAYEGWLADWRASGVAPVDIGLGSGLSFGPAIVGFMGPRGKKQVGVLGEPVNLAAYLCSQAHAGTLLVDCESFARAGTPPPAVTVTRLHSKKRHQRIRTVCLRYGGGTQRTRPLLVTLSSRIALPRSLSTLPWSWRRTHAGRVTTG
jgi:class 3 adenylate cyclase